MMKGMKLLMNVCLFVCFLNPTILEISGGSDQSPETWCLTPMKGLMLGVLKWKCRLNKGRNFLFDQKHFG